MTYIRHVGLIPDGTRRWSRENGIPLLSGYLRSMDNLISFINTCFGDDISSISIYMLSDLNLQRSLEDLEPVFEAEQQFLSNYLLDICRKWDSKVISAGDIEILPTAFKDKIVDICHYTSMHQKRRLYLLFAYSPFEEIRHAVDRASSGKVEIDHFWVNEYVDVIIRTAGGSTLLSNFLPIQSGYAQINMRDEYFNDLKQETVFAILDKARSVLMKKGR